MNSWAAVQTLSLSQVSQRKFPSEALMAPVNPGKHLPGLSRESFQVLPAVPAELQPCSIRLGLGVLWCKTRSEFLKKL